MNDNEVFTAEMARAMSEGAEARKLKAKRDKLLEAIKNSAMNGGSWIYNYGVIEVEYKYFEFDEGDYRWLEELGYKVTKPQLKIFTSYAGLREYTDNVPGKIEW